MDSKPTTKKPDQELPEKLTLKLKKLRTNIKAGGAARTKQIDDGCGDLSMVGRPLRDDQGEWVLATAVERSGWSD